jgi:hypothetical protein
MYIHTQVKLKSVHDVKSLAWMTREKLQVNKSTLIKTMQCQSNVFNQQNVKYQKEGCFILVCEILAISVSSVFNFGHFWLTCV